MFILKLYRRGHPDSTNDSYYTKIMQIHHLQYKVEKEKLGTLTAMKAAVLDVYIQENTCESYTLGETDAANPHPYAWDWAMLLSENGHIIERIVPTAHWASNSKE